MQHKHLLQAALLFCFFLYNNAIASVVMTGSRIIYNSSDKSVDVRLRNPDNIPYVIQSWLDDGDINSNPQTGRAPFIVTPPSFRIAANQGQVQRLSWVGNRTLPQDRESVFYYNFLQIPPSNLGSAKENKLLLIIKSRVKIFYRPSTITANSKKIGEMIQITSTTDGLSIKNNSPFYLSLSSMSVNGREIKGKMPMVAPFSIENIKTLSAPKGHDSKKVKIVYINDIGARLTNEYDIQ